MVPGLWTVFVAQVPRGSQGSESASDAQKSVRSSALWPRAQKKQLSLIKPARDAMTGAAPPTADSRTESALRQLRASIQDCTQCDALVRCRSRVVPGDGSVPAEVMFVGIAPGRLGGDRTGIPFSGDRSGQLLRRMIERSGLERVFITNLVRCNPRDGAGRNRDPTADEIARCREHLRAEFLLARPRIVACLGHIAWKELAGRAVPFMPTRGKPAKAEGLILYPMYHPAFVNRGAYPISSYTRDFARLARLCAGIRKDQGEREY
jgi:DNA polymerase